MMIDDFGTKYRQAMQAQAPAMFNELTHSGRMPTHLREKAEEANRLLTGLCQGLNLGPDGYPVDRSAYQAAVEQVLAVMLEFPQESRETS